MKSIIKKAALAAVMAIGVAFTSQAQSSQVGLQVQGAFPLVILRMLPVLVSGEIYFFVITLMKVL